MAENGQGQATAIVPCVANADETARRLADFLFSGIEPGMPGAQVHSLPVTVGPDIGHVFVIRIPQSWAGPHRVKTNYKFYLREGNRKRELDVPEIKALFVRAESQAQRIRDFRTERLGKMLTGNAPCKLVDGPIWVLHLVPTQAVLGVESVDPLPYFEFVRRIPCLGAPSHGNPRINLDGALGFHNENDQGATHGYTQLFRDGFVEAVYVVTPRAGAGNRPILHGATFEQHAAEFLRQIRLEFAHAGFHSECSAMMSLLNADQIELGFNRFNFNLDSTQGFFDRETVVLPDVLVSADVEPYLGLKPMFDLLWQSAGMRGSPNFNAAGVWQAPR